MWCLKITIVKYSYPFSEKARCQGGTAKPLHDRANARAFVIYGLSPPM